MTATVALRETQARSNSYGSGNSNSNSNTDAADKCSSAGNGAFGRYNIIKVMAFCWHEKQQNSNRVSHKNL